MQLFKGVYLHYKIQLHRIYLNDALINDTLNTRVTDNVSADQRCFIDLRTFVAQKKFLEAEEVEQEILQTSFLNC